MWTTVRGGGRAEVVVSLETGRVTTTMMFHSQVCVTRMIPHGEYYYEDLSLLQNVARQDETSEVKHVGRDAEKGTRNFRDRRQPEQVAFFVYIL